MNPYYDMTAVTLKLRSWYIKIRLSLNQMLLWLNVFCTIFSKNEKFLSMYLKWNFFFAFVSQKLKNTWSFPRISCKEPVKQNNDVHNTFKILSTDQRYQMCNSCAISFPFPSSYDFLRSRWWLSCWDLRYDITWKDVY